MIHYTCDRCNEPTTISEVVGIGVPNEAKGSLIYEDAPTGITMYLTLSKPDTDNQFCKVCMWSVLYTYIQTFGPKPHEVLHTMEYMFDVETGSIDVEEDGPDNGDTREDTHLSEVSTPPIMSFPSSDVSPEDGDRGIIRSVGGSTWSDRGSEGRPLHRAGWAASTKGAKRRWFRWNKSRLL